MQTSTNVPQAQPSLRRSVAVTLRALLLLTLFVCALLPAPRPRASAGQAALPNLQGTAASEYLKQKGLHASLGEAMAAARYGVYEAPVKDQASYHYYANNPAQQMQARFAPEGMSLHAASSEQQPWRLGLKLRSAGYGKRQVAVAPGTLSASGNRIEYDRPLANADQSAIKEWYVNRAEGLEQGFTLAQPVGERGVGERLRLVMQVEGEWQMRAVEEGRAGELRSRQGGETLHYDKLVVQDATGRELQARMQTQGRELWLEVEEAKAVYPVTIDPTFSQQAYLKASNTEEGDFFGWSVAVAGDTVVVGAPSESSSATGVNGDQSNNAAFASGAAYVFVRSGTTWTQQAYLKASNPEPGDTFGLSIAIAGDTMVVGAVSEDSNATGVNGDQSNNGAQVSGAAYVFVRSGTTWTQQAYLKASNTDAVDQFGFSVAVSGDTVVVGAYEEDSDATGVNGDQNNNSGRNSGAAYVFVRSGTTWMQQAYLKASNTDADDYFGWSVAVSGDTVVVGAYQEDSNATGVNGDQNNNVASVSGAAYVFVRSGTTWTQQAYLKASNTDAGDQFGVSVAVSGNTVVVGAVSEDSNATGVNGDQGNHVDEYGSGAAYVFVHGGTTWTQQAYLKASDTEGGSGFGFSVAVAGDTVAVGSPTENSSATGVNGDQYNSGAEGSGAAYVFVRSGTTWVQQAYLKASNTNTGDQFSYRVAVSGGIVIVGARFEASNATGVNGNQGNNSSSASGAAYVFTGLGVTNTMPTLASVGVTRQAGSSSSNSQIATANDTEDVANTLQIQISSDGTNFSNTTTLNGVTVTLTDSNADAIGINPNAEGQVFADVVATTGASNASFTLKVTDSSNATGTTTLAITVTPPPTPTPAPCNYWVQVRQPVASDGESHDQFGIAVAINGDFAIVGDSADDIGSNANQGSAYILGRNTGGADNWGFIKKLIAPDGVPNSLFGSSVAVTGNTILVSSPPDFGSVYIFERNQGGSDNWGLVKKIEASDKYSNLQFGRSVATDADTVVVGTSPANTANVGAAYIFERNAGGSNNWGEVRKLTASDGVGGNHFGTAVAISGSTVIAGAWQTRVGANREQGAAYVYERNTGGINNWGEVKRLVASDGTLEDGFGISVGVSGNTAIVGAFRDTVDGRFVQGSAYIFEGDSGGANNWGQVKKILAADGKADDQFGISASISGDRAIVGLWYNGTIAPGAAYTFGRGIGGVNNWGQAQKLAPSNGTAGDDFGFSVAISEETAIVGARYADVGSNTNQGAAYVFNVTCTSNASPTINANSLSRQAGSPSANSQIAATTDAEDAEETLQVQISSDGTNFGNTATLNGVTVTLTDSNTGADGINPNTTGQVFADVVASCGASNASFILKVTDSGGAIAMATFNITVNANTPPVLSYANQSVSSGGALTINPATGPSDNVGISSIAVLPPVTFTGSVMVNNATGVVTVSEAAPVGMHTITIRATDNCGGANGTTDASLTLTVNATGPTNTTTTVASSVNQSVFGQSVTFIATVAPVSAGAGTPTGNVNFVIDGGAPQTQALAGGVATFTTSSLAVGIHSVQATYLGNAQFNTSSGLLTGGQTVTCPAVTLTPASLPNGQVGTPYNQTLTAQPAGGNYTFAVTNGALPQGLSLDAGSGVISGAPSQTGNFSFRVTATGFGACSGARDYQISVPTCAAISINPVSLPGGTVGTAYSQTVSSSPAGTYNYSVTSGALPTGLTLNATTGAITGTSSQVGSFPFTITASVVGAFGCAGSRSFTVTIGCPAITLASLGNATAGVNFSGSMAASPSGAYTYSMQSGSLPSGLTLNSSTGAVTGLPSVSGTYSFTIKAQAANGCSGSQQYSLTVGCPSITLSALATPNLNSLYNQTVTASPSGNYSFAITAGALPAGLSLNAASGVISGTPTMAGTYNFTIRATGFGSCTGVREYSFVIAGGGCPTITLPASVPSGSVGQLYSHSVVASPVGLYNYSVTAGSLPPGVTLNSFLGSLFGYPTVAGGYGFTITATGANNCANSQAYTVNIGLGLMPESLPQAAVGQAYRQALASPGAQGEARFAVVAGALPSEMNLSRDGLLTGTPQQPGTHAFTVQVSDSAGFSGNRDYLLVLPPIFPPPSDPLAMTAAIDGCAVGGGTANATMTVRNFGGVSAPVNFEAPLPAGARALPDSCAANLGGCAATPQQVAWNGNLSPNQTVTITFRIQFDDNLSTQTCITASAKVVNVFGAPAAASACAVNCTVVGPGARLAAASPASDVKAGSVLIYNIFTSATDPARQNTRLSITNTDPARQAFVHLFFVDGASCSVADSFLCLTPNQTTSFLASDLDPGTTGYVVAVATDAAGCPVNFNFLIGDEYVKFQSGHEANLGAEAITAIAGGLPFCNTNSSTALLSFDGVSYNVLPHALAADNIPSRADGNDTLLVLNRIGGNLGIGAATLGSLFGLFYDDAETSLSFTFTPGTCQFRGSISNNFPRLAPRFEQFVPAGRSGWFKVWMPGLFGPGLSGMTGAVINFNANAGASAGAFNQGHNLHALTNTETASYIIPVFPPSC